MALYVLKMMLFGIPSAGKTSIVKRFINNEFSEKRQFEIGAGIYGKNIIIDDEEIKLTLFDPQRNTAHPSLDMIRFFKGFNGAGIFVYDVTYSGSLLSAEHWINLFRENRAPEDDKRPIIMVGNKIDLKENKIVSMQDAEMFANTNGIFKVIEVSALTGENVKQIFLELAQELLNYFNNN